MLVPIDWDNFKMFLYYSLEQSRIFVNDIGRKIQIVRQYRWKEIINRVVNLEHLWAILKKFAIVAALIEEFFIWYY